MDLSNVKGLYDENFSKYGIDPKTVGWGTEEKIHLRFEKLLNVIEDKENSFSINEIGCGYGELIKYCDKNNHQISNYTGIDISPKMIAGAKEYLEGYKNIELKEASELTEIKDFAITSGIFNVKFDEQEEKWKEYVLSVIKNLNKYSLKGFSFNMLTSYVDYKNKDLFYADPLYYFDLCKKEFSKNVSLLHDYDLYEFTIIVKK